MLNMKIVFFLLLVCSNIYAQHDIKATDQFTVEGAVKKSYSFTLKDANSYTSKSLDSIVISNHLKQRRGSIKNVRGILLKDVLAKVELNESSPKLLSEFYFVCTGSDGYKVVYSWNEIFNTATGNNIYIITEKDGQRGEAVPDRIAIICVTDDATGRRFVKGLAKIIVKRVE